MKKIGLFVLGLFMTLSSQGQTLQEAIAMTNGERFASAGTAFRMLIAGNPNDGETWFHYGENFYWNDKLDSAQFCYQQGASANPRHPLSYVGLGKLLWIHGKKDEAQAKFTEAIAASVDKANKFPKKLQAETEREVAEAMGFGNHKDTGKAMEHIEKALLLDPSDPEAFILKGDLQLEANPSDATGPLVNYKRAIDLQPSSARAVAKKALMYHRAVNYAAAISEYTKAIGLDAAFAPAYSGRAESFFMDKQYDLATADYNTYLALNKGDRSARVRYAKFLFLSKKYDEAIAEINSLRGSGETDATLKRLLGYANVEKGNFEEAKTALDEYFIEQDPAKIIAQDYEYMAKAYAGLAGTVPAGTSVANYDSLACEMCMRAATIDRNKDYMYLEAAKLFIKTKKFDRAVEAMRAKIANGKPETNDYYYLGDAALKGKMWATADSAWATYTERNPKAYQGYKYRARAQVGMDSARTTWGARPYFEEMLRKMKPEEMTKSPGDVEEAYFYLGFFNYYSVKDLHMAKCMFEKVKTVNAGTANTKIAMDMLLTKELKDVSASGTCEVLPQ